jgi:hypothetical protein
MKRHLFTSCALALLSLSVCGVVMAQIRPTNNPMDGWQQNDSASGDLNSILNPSQNSNFSVPGLMNRLRLLDGRDPNEIAADQMENLSSEAEAFRRRQREQFQNSTVTP